MKRQDADKEERLVSVQARGTDVRDVLADLFTQAKCEFVLSDGIEKKIYLSVRDVPFTKALQMVCESAGLQFSLRDQIYLIQPAMRIPNSGLRTPDPTASEQEVLKRKVNLNFHQASIEAITADLRKQSGVPIELEKGVPNYRINAKLWGTTLETALDAICKGTGLQYQWTGQGFRITRTFSAATVSPSRVITLAPPKIRISGEKASPRTAPARNVVPGAGAVCPKCRALLEGNWNYCPLCGAWVKPLTQSK
jgi:hypothetical protein